MLFKKGRRRGQLQVRLEAGGARRGASSPQRCAPGPHLDLAIDQLVQLHVRKGITSLRGQRAGDAAVGRSARLLQASRGRRQRWPLPAEPAPSAGSIPKPMIITLL